ncbi:MAG: thioesterase family protein [Pseudomonadales bacterium]
MHHFDLETRSIRSTDNAWYGTLSGAWNIGANPNGGYLLSVVLGAIRQAVPHPDPLTLTTHYLRPGTGGAPFTVLVDVVRTGRTLSTVRARLEQEGTTRIEVLAAMGDLDTPLGVDASVTLPPPAIARPEHCTPRDAGEQGVELPIRHRLDVRIATPPEAEPTAARIDGWVRLADGRAPDTATLPLFCDGFPPSPFSLLGRIGWVPTIELTVHVLRRPAPGWIQAAFVTDSLSHGRMIESGCLWDEQGALVAQSRQLGLVRGG